jgi:HAD superfamily hydrolase (TIGR01509 family)
MIKAFVFDLDGTLVQTEILKAHSYAKAVEKLKPGKYKVHDIIDSYKKLVGHSREEVASYFLLKYNLEEGCSKLVKEFKIKEPWEAFIKIRLKYYFEFLNNPRILNTVKCTYSTQLLKKVKQQNYKTALATTSHLDEATKVLETLELNNLFDFIATRDKVKNSKPDPEIYKLVISKLKVKAEECLAIEDSMTGIKAALAAKVNCIAATNDYTIEAVNNTKIIDKKWVVNDLKNLNGIVEDMIRSNA